MVKLNSNNPSISEFTRYAALGAASFVINLGLAATFHEILVLAEWLAVRSEALIILTAQGGSHLLPPLSLRSLREQSFSW